MSTLGGEQIAADGETGVLRLALTRGVPLLRLVSEVGKVGVLPVFWGVRSYYSKAWGRIVRKESRGLPNSIYPRPVSCLRRPRFEMALGSS